MRQLCFLLLFGVVLCTPRAALADDAKVQYASLWVKSGRVYVPEPEELLVRPCNNGKLCANKWSQHTNWPQLPPIVVVKPAERQKVVAMPRRVAHVARVRAAGNAPAQSIAQNTQNTAGRDTARGVSIQAVQIAGNFLGLDPTIGLGICAVMTFSYMVQDGVEAKEQWTITDALGNMVISAIGCSPLGIVMRLAQMNASQPTAQAATATKHAARPVRMVKRQVRQANIASSQSQQ
jgi:hypothetical protein